MSLSSAVHRRLCRIAGVAAPLLLLPAIAHALSWEIGTASWRYGVYTSLALDSQARAHISYFDVSSQLLAYSRFDGRTFQTEVVDDARGAGNYDAIALDSQDQPHISYFYSYNGVNQLRHAHFDGTAWQIETVAGGSVGPTSLKLDKQGLPHIAFASGLARGGQLAVGRGPCACQRERETERHRVVSGPTRSRRSRKKARMSSASASGSSSAAKWPPAFMLVQRRTLKARSTSPRGGRTSSWGKSA